MVSAVSKIDRFSLVIKNSSVFLSSQVKSLSAIIDSNYITWSAYLYLCNISHLHPSLPPHTTSIIVTFRLDYYSSLFFGLTHKSLHKIQLVQNSAARIITRTTLHTASLLFRLHWLPLKFHINFQILLLVFKAITPPYLSDLLHVVTSSCTLRSSSFLHLTVPSACLTIKGFRAFSCPAPRLWNFLFSNIRYID